METKFKWRVRKNLCKDKAKYGVYRVAKPEGGGEAQRSERREVSIYCRSLQEAEGLAKRLNGKEAAL